MFAHKTKQALTQQVTGKARMVWWGKTLGFFSVLFVCTMVFDRYALEKPNLPFFRTDFCLAFADPADCPIDPIYNASLPCAPGPVPTCDPLSEWPTCVSVPTLSTWNVTAFFCSSCSACNPFACACPCPYGDCPTDMIVGPCPGDVGGAVCPQGAMCSPGGCDQQCPTGQSVLNNPGLASVPGFRATTSDADYCREICPANLCGHGTPSDDDERLMDFLAVIEVVYFCIGMTFALTVGPNIYVMESSNLKTSVQIIFGILCFFMISWYPHVRMHLAYTETDQILLLDFLLHIPIAICSMFLIVYVYRMLRMSSGWVPPEPSDNLVKDFFTSIPFIAGCVSVAFAIAALLIGRQQSGMFYNASASLYTESQRGATWTVNFVQAIEFGISMGFLVIVAPVLKGADDRRVVLQAVPLIFSLWFLIANWYWHSLIHSSMSIPFRVTDYFLVEFLFHWTSQICSLIVTFNMYIIIQMALALENSPFKKGGKGTASRTGKSKSGKPEGSKGSQTERETSGIGSKHEGSRADVPLETTDHSRAPHQSQSTAAGHAVFAPSADSKEADGPAASASSAVNASDVPIVVNNQNEPAAGSETV